MRNDRQSVYEQEGKDFNDAMKIEFGFGMKSLASKEVVDGVGSFQGGSGRGGKITSKI